MKTFCRLVWLYVVTVTLCWGQASPVFQIRELPDEGVLLDTGWKWHRGDSLDWAKPKLDDSTWESIDPTQDIMELPQVRQAGRGWFRLRFSVDSLLVGRLALMIFQSGASELYLDGRLIHHLGVLSANPNQIKAYNPRGNPVSLPIVRAGQHVLAIRYGLQPGVLYTAIFGHQSRGFKAVLHTMEGANEQYYQANNFKTIAFTIGIFFILSILYLAFYLFYPVQKANLYFSLYAGMMTINFVTFLYTDSPHAVQLEYPLLNFVLGLYVTLDLLLLMAIYTVLERPKGRFFRMNVCIGIISVLSAALIYGWGWMVFPTLFMNLINVDITRIAFKAIANQRKDAWIIAVGCMSYLIFWALVCLKMEIYLGNLYINTFTIAHLSVPIAVSVYLGYDFALAHRSLQQQLVTVERLSDEKQQILTSQNEVLERQLVERTREIEAQSRLLEAQHIRQLETEFERRLADTEMVALRAQMNPHFIFNCLNSIKLYTLQNDSEQASDFLTKFSRLIRLVLENSRSEQVTLRNELEALQLYIELEAMRFKEKLRYQISVLPEVDPQYLRIPPLLLQPFVENAIWHGLMHKPEGGTVIIEVRQPQDNLLHIEITDDGVGRQRASELKSKSAGKHKSFGMQVTADRIRMINQRYNIQTHTQILDLVDSYGDPAGTKVVLEIPV